MEPSSADAPGARILRLWGRLSAFPGGDRIFSRLLGRMVPYTGKLGARVEELEPGHARVSLRDRRRVRNHLRSVHAVALTNLGELSTGLAVLTALRPGTRGIVTELCTEYTKKARGRLVAQCDVTLPERAGQAEVEVDATAAIRDSEGDEVARVTATWLTEPTS